MVAESDGCDHLRITLRLQGVAVLYNQSLRIIYISKYLLNWFLFALKLYKHTRMQIPIATDKSGNQATKTYDRML
jgi:hypothetical protein